MAKTTKLPKFLATPENTRRAIVMLPPESTTLTRAFDQSSDENNMAALQAMKEELEADRRKASEDQAALAELEAAAGAKAAELAAVPGPLEPPSPATPSATPTIP